MIVFIIASILLSHLLIGVNASTELTQKEAESLFAKGYQNLFMLYFTGLPKNSIIKDTDWVKIFSADAEIYFDDYAEFITYYIVTDERFNTMEKCYAFAKEVFTDEIAISLIDINGAHLGSTRDIIPSFRTLGTEYNIRLYGLNKEDLPLTPDTIVIAFGTFRNINEELKSVGKLTVNGDSAVLPVVYEKTFVDIETGYFLRNLKLTVDFTKTANGWRISGGTLFDYLMGKISLENLVAENPDIIIKNPSTSDKAPLYIAAIALVSLAAPVVMKRRRREF